MTELLILNLPKFPEFRSLRLSDKGWYDTYAKGLKPYADFNFNTLMVWFNKTHALELSYLNKNIVIRYPDVLHNNSSPIYTLYGNCDIDKTLDELFIFLKSQNLQQQIKMVPEDVVDNIVSNKYLYKEDRDNSEYILDCQMIAELPGKNYSSKRENCNAFNNKYGDSISIEKVDLDNTSNKELIYNSYINWSQSKFKKTNNDPEQNEKGVIESILANSKSLQYKCITIKVKNMLASFILYYYPAQEGFVMPSVIKSNYYFQDIFDYTVNALAKYQDSKIKYINFEQDLGIEGLKKYKSSLRPVSFLKKYNIKPA